MVYYVKIQKYVIWRNHMILACQNISKAFGTTEIIKNASFHIEEREKAALVGINGAGKSTLLKIIIGEMRADEGEVILSKGKTMGYLAQHQDLTGHLSIYQEVLTAKQNLIDMKERLRQMESDMNTKSGAELDELLSTYTRLSHTFELENGYAYRSEVVGVLKGLGFSESDFEKQVDSLSGGQKTRVALGKLLLTKPDIILLDEPTNHLDMDSISWLETYLLNYSGAVLIVSHDRYFLDRVVTKVVEVDNKKVTTFEGNYTAYSQKKAMLREAAYHAWVNQQQEIHHQEEVIAKLKSFNREKSIKRAESREKMLDKMDVLEKPTEVRSDMRIRLEPRITSGNDVLTVEHLSKAFPGQTLFQDLNFEIKRGERVAIIGNNGTGKTTILNAMSGYIPQEERIITIEDSAELQIRHVKNLVSLETRVENRDGSQEISMRDLIRASLRMRPDRIIVGEVRGGEALEMLQAMNTGHDGSLSTGHANSAKDMLSRLETMVLMAAELPLAAVRSQIGSALDLMVHVGRMRDRSRKVLEITEVIGYENGEIRLSPIYQFQESGEAGSGQVEGALVQVGRFEGRRRFAGGSAF